MVGTHDWHTDAQAVGLMCPERVFVVVRNERVFVKAAMNEAAGQLFVLSAICINVVRKIDTFVRRINQIGSSF